MRRFFRLNLEKIEDKLRLSLLLELQTTPKPGCVDKNHEHEDMSFIDFIKSSLAIGRAFEENSQLKIGELIYKSTKEMIKSHSGVNTHFGSILLHAPLFKASKTQKNDIEEVIKKANEIIKYSDVEDSISFYNALNLVEIGGLGEREELNAGSHEAIVEISEKEIDFNELMEISSQRDDIAKELVNSFERTQRGYQFLKNKEIKNNELVKAFIYLLQKPDTHIQKIYSRKTANKISKRAKNITENDFPMKEIKKLDKELNKKSISPGTTADILSSSIYLRLLDKSE